MTEEANVSSAYAPGTQPTPTSQEGVYDVEPKEADDQIIINLSETVAVVPMDHDRGATIRMERGDRLRTKNYASVLVEKVSGLSFLKDVDPKLAEKLEHERKVRVGLEPSEYVKEAHAMKGKEPVTNQMSSGSAIQDAIRDAQNDD